MAPSPQYIQYMPLIFAAINRPFTNSVTIPADLYGVPNDGSLSLGCLYFSCAYLPPSAFRKAGPYLVQCIRSREVAIPTEYVSRFHCVYVSTYIPSADSTMRGSSTPPGHSRAF